MNYKNFLQSTYHIREFSFNKENHFLMSIQKAKKANKKYLKNLEGYKGIFALTDFIHLTDFGYVHPLDTNKKLTCIFCLKSVDDTSFSQKAHVIPEFLGNKYLLHYEECDECNSYFSSSIEDALDKFTTIYRVFNRTKNKKNKLINYRSINQKSFGKFNLDDTRFEFLGYESDFLIDFEKKTMVMQFDIPKHRPSNIYKAFMKIVYGLLPKNELQNFSLLRSWINDRDQTLTYISPLTVYKSNLPFFNHKPLNIIIIKKDTKSIDEVLKTQQYEEDIDYMGLISFGNVVFEFPIFSDNMIQKVQKIKNFKFNIKFMPKPFFTGNPEALDLSSSEYKIDRLKMNFSFDSLIEEDIDVDKST